MHRRLITLALFAAACGAAPLSPAVQAADAVDAPNSAEAASQAGKTDDEPDLDRSGRTRRGKASFYSLELAGQTMADGTPMDPHSNTAASRTLPLGTTARVTNLRNGRSAVVEIRDRGPYAKGRILDVSPSIARALGMHHRGVATVKVAPIDVPQADGSIRHGSGYRATASRKP